jgi:hypothetical protein
MNGAAMFGALGLPVIFAGMGLCLIRARLPAAFWLVPTGWWGWTTTVLLSLLAVVALLVLLEVALDGNPFTTPVVVATLYLLLCGRAAAARAWHAAFYEGGPVKPSSE